MTIGPLPSTRILWMSSLRGNEVQEAVEEVNGVVRAWACFGVVLRCRARDIPEDQALHRSVVEVHVGELGRAEVGLPAHRLVLLDAPLSAGAKHCEAVVLRGDVDPPGRQVLHRVVGAAVAERQLEGLEADRPAQELMPEADPEHRHLADDAAYRLDHVVECRRIARPIRKEDRIRLARKQLFRRGSGRVQLQAHAALARVSISAIAGMPQSRSQVSQPPSAPAESSRLTASRMTTARARTLSDSIASAETP